MLANNCQSLLLPCSSAIVIVASQAFATQPMQPSRGPWQQVQDSYEAVLRCTCVAGFRRMAMQRWRQNRTGGALIWAGRAGDTEMAEAFAAPLVQAIEEELCSSSCPDHSRPGQASSTGVIMLCCKIDSCVLPWTASVSCFLSKSGLTMRIRNPSVGSISSGPSTPFLQSLLARLVSLTAAPDLVTIRRLFSRTPLGKHNCAVAPYNDLMLVTHARFALIL